MTNIVMKKNKEVVNFPIQTCDFPWFRMLLPEGIDSTWENNKSSLTNPGHPTKNPIYNPYIHSWGYPPFTHSW